MSGQAGLPLPRRSARGEVAEDHAERHDQPFQRGDVRDSHSALLTGNPAQAVATSRRWATGSRRRQRPSARLPGLLAAEWRSEIATRVRTWMSCLPASSTWLTNFAGSFSAVDHDSPEAGAQHHQALPSCWLSNSPTPTAARSTAGSPSSRPTGTHPTGAQPAAGPPDHSAAGPPRATSPPSERDLTPTGKSHRQQPRHLHNPGSTRRAPSPLNPL